MSDTTRVDRLRAAMRKLGPDRALLSSDLVAALTFAVVNVPQAMGHALLATVNPVLGIFTLMVAVPVGTIFNSSVFMNVSSTAALSVAAGVALVDVPADRRVEALVMLVLLVGAIQLLAGLFRLGFLVRFVSNAVMTGFLNGVAVLIILGQLSDLTGYASEFSNRVAQALDLLLRLNRIDLWVSLIGVCTLGLIVLLLWVKRLQRFAFIIAIAAATVLLAVLTIPALPSAAPSRASPRSATSPRFRVRCPGLRSRICRWSRRCCCRRSRWPSSASFRVRVSARAPPTPTAVTRTCRATSSARVRRTSRPASSAAFRPAARSRARR